MESAAERFGADVFAVDPREGVEELVEADSVESVLLYLPERYDVDEDAYFERVWCDFTGYDASVGNPFETGFLSDRVDVYVGPNDRDIGVLRIEHRNGEESTFDCGLYEQAVETGLFEDAERLVRTYERNGIRAAVNNGAGRLDESYR